LAAKCKLLQLTFFFIYFFGERGLGLEIIYSNGGGNSGSQAEVPLPSEGLLPSCGPNFSRARGKLWKRAEQLRLPYVVAYDLLLAALKIEISGLLPVLRGDPSYKSCKGLAVAIRNLPGAAIFESSCAFSQALALAIVM